MISIMLAALALLSDESFFTAKSLVDFNGKQLAIFLRVNPGKIKGVANHIEIPVDGLISNVYHEPIISQIFPSEIGRTPYPMNMIFENNLRFVLINRLYSGTKDSTFEIFNDANPFLIRKFFHANDGMTNSGTNGWRIAEVCNAQWGAECNLPKIPLGRNGISDLHINDIGGVKAQPRPISLMGGVSGPLSFDHRITTGLRSLFGLSNSLEGGNGSSRRKQERQHKPASLSPSNENLPVRIASLIYRRLCANSIARQLWLVGAFAVLAWGLVGFGLWRWDGRWRGLGYVAGGLALYGLFGAVLILSM